MTAYRGPDESDFARDEVDGWQPERVPRLPGDEWMRTTEASDPGGASGEEPVANDPAAQPAGPDPTDVIPPGLQLAFAPLHKRAFGMAVGAACALVVAALTLFHLVLDPGSPNLGLLSQYFYGYTVTRTGLLVGAGWGFVVGFVGGWFFAFCRNLALATSMFISRTRAELAQTRDFLDHI
ncbi:MAG: hypothetical protein ACRELX_07555 [Longimicrobiales bacterium]